MRVVGEEVKRIINKKNLVKEKVRRYDGAGWVYEKSVY